MSDTNEEPYLDERYQRALANTAVAMQRAGAELSSRAWKIADEVLKKIEVVDPAERAKRLAELIEYMEAGNYNRLKEKDQAILLTQGEVAIEEQLAEHANCALYQAAAAEYQFRRVLSPLTSPAMRGFDEALLGAFEAMQDHLFEAQRHSAALDILHNIKHKMYTSRASNAGKKRLHPATGNEQQQLLSVMIKTMIYNRGIVLDAGKHNLNNLAEQWAQEIFTLNKTCPILDIPLGQLQVDILTLLQKKEKTLQK